MPPKKTQYATTLPVSRDSAHLVRVYCVINSVQVHEYLNKLIEKDLEEFKQGLKQLRKAQKEA